VYACVCRLTKSVERHRSKLKEIQDRRCALGRELLSTVSATSSPQATIFSIVQRNAVTVRAISITKRAD
jgi:hypothetical protein